MSNRGLNNVIELLKLRLIVNALRRFKAMPGLVIKHPEAQHAHMVALQRGHMAVDFSLVHEIVLDLVLCRGATSIAVGEHIIRIRTREIVVVSIQAEVDAAAIHKAAGRGVDSALRREQRSTQEHKRDNADRADEYAEAMKSEPGSVRLHVFS